ncbi:vitamin K epoxide reductase family protein, partial [Parafilimonas sp.]|uniref:vitamin K epoxide reductase family protein n=1 Tax=Parafilimonas sp. TaxID=1969739 RepID=UPI0039E35CE1
MFAIFNQYEPPVTVTIQLLSQLQVKVTAATVNETILNHPDYPSLLSISDALNTWHVENAAVSIENDKLGGLPLPFIAFIKSNPAFVLITAVKDGKVFYLTGTNKTTAKELPQFTKEFGGVALLAQAGENAGEKNYRQSKKAQFKKQAGALFCFVAVVALLFVSVFLFINNNLQHYLLFPFLSILNFAGLITSVILLWYETDKTNPALQKICTGPKTNCNAVLHSRAAKIAGLSWSELGFIYFAGLYLLLLLTGFTNNPALLPFIELFNLAAIVYVPFSLFYQWKVVRQWCPLCLTVQAILLLQFVVVVSYQSSAISPYQPLNLATLSTISTAFVLPAIAWFIIKPLLQVKQKAKQDFHALQRIKFNTEIFNALLEKQKHLTEPTDELGIILGNKNATNTLIKVCNPYCGPCAKAHPEIEKLLEENNNLKVQIIFTATNDEHDTRALPAKHLLAIAANNNETITKQALDDWYLADKKDYDVFAAKYPMPAPQNGPGGNGELKMQNRKIQKMKEWCDKVDISFTPTFFVSVPSPKG